MRDSFFSHVGQIRDISVQQSLRLIGSRISELEARLKAVAANLATAGTSLKGIREISQATVRQDHEIAEVLRQRGLQGIILNPAPPEGTGGDPFDDDDNDTDIVEPGDGQENPGPATGSGQTPGPSDGGNTNPGPAPPSSGTPGFNLSQVVWLHTNVSGWSQTSRITSVSISSGSICTPHTKAGRWPTSSINGTVVEGNPWIFAYENGRWYGATYEWLRPGQTCKGITASNIAAHIKKSPLNGSWRPTRGRKYGFMVSTRARIDGGSAGKERSNIVFATWP
jgi:hypothetical protein